MWHQVVLAKKVTYFGEGNIEAVLAAAVPHDLQGAFRQTLRPISLTLGAIILCLRSEGESVDANRDEEIYRGGDSAIGQFPLEDL